ncbi:NAD(P)-dependent oxidoreductase [Dysgonomonadaceae bacterium zrk40]|nr:NAD(P)-dependent oxidoreductase [Dysgonomonadaceae bacterium zrk40]
MRDKILITGGSGFIGSNLIEHFAKKNCDILNLDLNAPNILNQNIYWKNIDITDRIKLEREVINFNPNYVLHLAARTDLNGKSLNEYKTNTYGTLNLIKSCNTLKQIQRVILTSSMLVCKPGYSPNHPTDYDPSTIYGQSKVEMENIIRREKLNFEWAIVRPTSIWGPGFGVPYRNFFDMVIDKRYFHIGHTACTKTYGYIENIVYQIDSILNAPYENIQSGVFYLGDYDPTNIRTWADEIGTELGIKIKTIPYSLIKIAALGGDVLKKVGVNFPMTSFRLKNMTTDNVLDLSNTKELAPNLPFTRKEGIKKTLEWLKQNP